MTGRPADTARAFASSMSVRSPVGRVQRFVVRPFSFTEFLVACEKEPLSRDLRGGATVVSPGRHRRLLEHLDQYLLVGGLPEVVLTLAAKGDFHRRRGEIIADYEQDFIRLFGEEAVTIASSGRTVSLNWRAGSDHRPVWRSTLCAGVEDMGCPSSARPC